MNRVIPLPPADWRAHLAALPDVDPPETLWLRVAAARREAPSTRGRWPWLAAVAAAVVAAVLAWPRGEPTPAQAPPLAQAAPAVPVDASLRRLDDEIALAYSRNASEAELAALWETRGRLIETQRGTAPALLAHL